MKAIQKLLALVLLITLCVPSLSLTANAETNMNFMQDATNNLKQGGRYEAMDSLPDGSTEAIVFDSTSSGREMRYHLQYLPANGQYHLSFWYKTAVRQHGALQRYLCQPLVYRHSHRKRRYLLYRSHPSPYVLGFNGQI